MAGIRDLVLPDPESCEQVPSKGEGCERDGRGAIGNGGDD
jgi:hypothetical protein